jgi:hypothetical protein
MSEDLGKVGLDTDQLLELLELVKGSKSVELKLTVPAESHRQTIEQLDIDPLEGQMRLVTFFDTPDLALNKAGVVVRARRIQGKGADSVVKLRPVRPDDIPDKLRRLDALGIEVDAMPGGFVCSASFKGVADGPTTKLVSLGKAPVRKAFNKEQRAFYKTHAPEGLELDDLSVLGPIFVLKIPFTPEELAHKLVLEMWLYPDGSRILELSTKCAPADLTDTIVNVRRFLVERGVDRHGEQQTKTKRALEYFAANLTKQAAGQEGTAS